MAKSRELKPGEYVPEESTRRTGPELVRVHHADLDRTLVVRRSKLRQMDPAWEVVEDPQTDMAELKGAALNQALKDAGLPTTGRADEKRARLAEHEATLLAASAANVDAAVITENTKE